MADYPAFETLRVSTLAPRVLGVELHRPEKLNAMSSLLFEEVSACFEAVQRDSETRAVVLHGAGRGFSAGLDLTDGGLPLGSSGQDVAHTALSIRRLGVSWQRALSLLEECGRPVIACMHGAVVGAGLEMISACDVRFCTADAFFVAAEVDAGLAADIGGLQRLPKIVGNQSLVRELVMSGRRLSAQEAAQHGLVSRLLADKAQMMEEGVALASQLAAKSPVVMLGVKELLNFSRDHTVEDSLRFALTWNMAMLQGGDVKLAAAGLMMKQTPKFPDLPDARSKL